MVTISLCMIVKNEQAVLARCLKSVAPAVDEIIIVDTGSSDATKQIAQQYTPHVYDFEWIDDFSAARNFSFSKATMDYQMWLDADDVLPEEECAKLIALKSTLNADVDIVTMRYNLNYDEHGQPTFSSLRERLIKRARGYLWIDPIHECIPLSGNIYASEVQIYHRKLAPNADSKRNLNIYTALEKSGATLTPRQMYYFSRELKDHGQYEKAIHYFKKFLDSKKGWVEDNISVCHNLSICYNMLGHKQKALQALLKSFHYASPRAEIVCDIGYHYKSEGDFKRAIDWFNIARSLEKPSSYCFINHESYDYIPLIELCVCYYKLSDMQHAEYFNELAAQIKPDSISVKQNREFFSSLKNPRNAI